MKFQNLNLVQFKYLIYVLLIHAKINSHEL